ncbi:hypothetical protein IGL98_001103 [Enterococcus sp. DIV0840]|uniref:sensor histidine kinase n=1 Tax=Enterococcus TaxID=1350 RepID=UPI001A8D67F8|nr:MULTISPECIES: HAMP domain-containing sensor histidine kinase [Enterococcus]MBO0435386.1 HAMP domain-containing histidine kinase [Enterococcus sp. DIV0849a]MBO0473745.1 HAMP domain-containing histidine kinase [Enterococcus ureasiticus]
MSLQKQITLLVSGLLISMSLIMLLFSVSGANKNFSVQRLARIESAVVDSSVKPDEVSELGMTLAKARMSFSSSLIFVWVIVIVVGTFITYKLVGRSLGSLVSLQKTMSRLDTENIGKKIDVDQKQPKEVQALSMSYNEMTARLDESFIKQKNFVNNAAHELKTPLAVIITYTQLLQMNLESDEESNKMTEAILSSCDKLSITLEQLLVLANDNLLQLADTISTDYLINEAFADVSLQALDRKIHLENKSQKDSQFKGNKSMLSVALKNLVENAVKYGDEDSTVTVTTISTKKDITFEVENSGQVIKEEEIERIFEPFYRGQSINNQIIGNGLGLALVKKIIENHSGKVSCSTQGKEVTFRFSIPIRE